MKIMLSESTDETKRAAYLATALNFIYYLARACSKKYVLGLAVLYSQSGAVAGFVYSLYTIAQLAAALAVGRLAGKYGNKPWLVCGSALMVAGAVITAFSGNLGMVAAGNILMGLAHGHTDIFQAVVVVVTRRKIKACGVFLLFQLARRLCRKCGGGYCSHGTTIWAFSAPWQCAVCAIIAP